MLLYIYSMYSINKVSLTFSLPSVSSTSHTKGPKKTDEQKDALCKLIKKIFTSLLMAGF